MNRKNENLKVVALLPAQKQSDAELLERLVHERVDEILASREDLLLRPFFDSKRVSSELRNLQTMGERRKWPKYFESHGCLICETRDVPHCALGMCTTCHVRVARRIRAILAEDARAQESAKFANNLESTARRAVRQALNALPAKRETKP
ncbi:MAG TPA: hypothetical protein VMV59_00850 [Candidatus Dormibacteraeota bacterium]|nr:hypothetical protein [Candidatus Dormibacteraeota bacterium]